MKTDTKFTDAGGREWTIAINSITIKRVRERLQIDLLDASGKVFIDLLYKDVIKLVDVLYVVCQLDAERQNISDEDFGRALVGDALDQATDALVKGIGRFLGTVRGSAILAAYEKSSQIGVASFNHVSEQIQSLDVQQLIADAAEKISTDTK